MYVIIQQKAIPLICHRCEYYWLYKQKNDNHVPNIAICPKCRTTVTIRKSMVLQTPAATKQLRSVKPNHLKSTVHVGQETEAYE